MKENPQNIKAPWWQPGLVLFARMSGWIAVPVIIGVFVGKYLDRKFHTEPWLFLASVGAAFILSMFGIVKDAMQAMKEIEMEDKSKIQSSNVKQNPKS
jgi:F0F1-type ATP synthase assembly protein I